MARDTDQTSTSREEVERNVEHELRQQADAYRDGTAGSPAAVARWLRILAEKLEAADQSSERRANTPASTALSKEERSDGDGGETDRSTGSERRTHGT